MNNHLIFFSISSNKRQNMTFFYIHHDFSNHFSVCTSKFFILGIAEAAQRHNGRRKFTASERVPLHCEYNIIVCDLICLIYMYTYAAEYWWLYALHSSEPFPMTINYREQNIFYMRKFHFASGFHELYENLIEMIDGWLYVKKIRCL